MGLVFKNFVVQHPPHQISIKDWSLEDEQSWFLFCSQGLNLELLWQAILDASNNQLVGLEGVPQRVALVSLSEQQRLLEIELAKEDTDFTNEVDPGTSVEKLVAQHLFSSQELEPLLHQLDLVSLRSSGFRQLSTGETRRLMLALALAKQPQLLLLDDPFAGLDIEHQGQLRDIISGLSGDIQILMSSSREQDICEGINWVSEFSTTSLTRCLSKAMWLSDPLRQQLANIAQAGATKVLQLFKHAPHNYPAEVLFALRDGKVSYQGELLFKDVNWTINSGEHWQIRGPNGCGKSTLLQFISGDHPQCYCNDIEVLGYKRGHGESIWQVKQGLAIVSSALHLAYRVNIKAFEVVLSGLFDSIGLYQKYGEKERHLAHKWMGLFAMSDFTNTPFRELTYGQQRVLLILRALIKRPKLLLLDEPCQGLDYLNRELVLAALELIGQQKSCQLVYVSHYAQDRLGCVDKLLDFEMTSSGHYEAHLSDLKVPSL
ncbi:ATP-binding cassette domain-containing protein [Alginatibacterium sediminis]|uniref:ATP-binding cassette domain-containing protein n=1 Tax=Alginatibacterium sediminis TaxID=2164068 RepID=A0A420E7B2_9ALTE|nr:ATP-binding cassette domain-containing protein [Alginatibacterium sediminis]RKF14308.1 ATP-binding cassette domain-containing protein [Alginatibacterium sediminis]